MNKTELIAFIAERSLVSTDRLLALFDLAISSLDIKGDFYEFGVYKGGTALFLAHLTANSGKKLRLFDSFAGMSLASEWDNYHKEGDFQDTKETVVRELLKDFDHVEFYPGFIPHSFSLLPAQPIALAHIDVDLYQSTNDALQYAYSNLTPGGVAICDDYGFESCLGAQKAMDEFMIGKPEELIKLDTKQALFKKL